MWQMPNARKGDFKTGDPRSVAYDQCPEVLHQDMHSTVNIVTDCETFEANSICQDRALTVFANVYGICQTMMVKNGSDIVNILI